MFKLFIVLPFTSPNSDDFVVDTVVSSSELLSDASDANVITFEESRDGQQDDGAFGFHNASIAVAITVVCLLAVAVFVSVTSCHPQLPLSLRVSFPS
jgi:hypothetical protein